MKTFKSKFWGLSLISLFTILRLGFSACNKDDDETIENNTETPEVNNYLIVLKLPMKQARPLSMLLEEYNTVHE